MVKKNTVVLLFAAGLFCASPSTVLAGGHGDAVSSSSAAPGGLTVWGILGHHHSRAGFGVGIHYMIPLGEGLLHDAGVRDGFSLELGADLTTFYYYDHGAYLRIRPAVGVLWTFWLLDELALYPKLDVGMPVWFLHPNRGPLGWPGPNFALGLLYALDGLDLRVELGAYGLHLGALFRF